MQQPPDITLRSVSSLARALACGELSSSEVVAAHIKKINALSPSINAIVQLPAERALEEAIIVDRAPQGRQSALRGLPLPSRTTSRPRGLSRRSGCSSARLAALE